jgi:SAM-dependent methyltransferase
MTEAIAATWTPTVCPICNRQEERERLGVRQQRLQGRTRSLEMCIEDMLCLACGFVHAGARPDQEALFLYYSDAHTRFSQYAEIRPDYDLEKRLILIERFIPRGGRILELGAGTGEFCQALCERGWSATPIDPLGERDKLPRESGFDAALAYLLLEHVHDPREFLIGAGRRLSAEGILIVEVPDFLRDPVASLQPEHFWHFTPKHLAALLADCGLNMIETDGEGASRHFAFTSVARRGAGAPHRPLLSGMVERARAAYRRAERLIADEETRASRLAGFMSTAAAPRIYVWGANEYATRIGYRLSEAGVQDVHIIDSATTKIGTLHDGFAHPIEPPVFSGDEPEGCYVLLCSPTWNAEIRRAVGASTLRAPRIVDAVTWRPELPQ